MHGNKVVSMMVPDVPQEMGSRYEADYRPVTLNSSGTPVPFTLSNVREPCPRTAEITIYRSG